MTADDRSPVPGPVNVKLEVPPTDQLKTGGVLEITLRPSEAAGTQATAGAEALLQGVARLSPALKGRAAELIAALRARESEVMNWLHQSEANAEKFAADPLGALKEARIGPELVAGLDALSQELVAHARKRVVRR